MEVGEVNGQKVVGRERDCVQGSPTSPAGGFQRLVFEDGVSGGTRRVRAVEDSSALEVTK